MLEVTSLNDQEQHFKHKSLSVFLLSQNFLDKWFEVANFEERCSSNTNSKIFFYSGNFKIKNGVIYNKQRSVNEFGP